MESSISKSTEEVTHTLHVQSKSDISTTPNSDTKNNFTSVTTIEITESNDSNYPDDIVILRKDPTTKRSIINKSAYAKLHRTLSPGRTSNTIENLKEKYENNKKPDLLNVKNEHEENTKTEQLNETDKTQLTYSSKRTSPVKLDEETVKSLKNKYSPGSFGYPRTSKNSKLPVPKPRSAVKSQIIPNSSRQPDRNLRYSLDIDRKGRQKDENSNDLHRKSSSSSGEFITIITRSESEASVDKFEKELNLFTMDGKPREKKRSGLKKIFSSKIFGKDKKKKEEEKQKLQYKESAAVSLRPHNESDSFNRQANRRHTTDSSSVNRSREVKVNRSESEKYNQPKKVYITKDMEEKYAQMHINQFKHIKQAFENSESANQVSYAYAPMNQPIIKNNPGPTNYMNLPNVRKYIDTSSSASTMESDKSNIYQNTNKDQNLTNDTHEKNDGSLNTSLIKFDVNKDTSRDTPPRAQELRQGVRLVNPKALIPINSERPLPNPYQNNYIDVYSDSETKVKSRQSQPRFEETYGTVFDNLEYNKDMSRVSSELNIQKPPRSPSLESTKLKLPPNREIVPLSPRIRSPIPHDNISTEKIIATELLKPTKSPPSPRKNIPRVASSSHQRLEIDIDYPDINNSKRNEKPVEGISSKPPISKMPFRSNEINSLTKQRQSRRSPLLDDRLSQASQLSEAENTSPKYKNNQGLNSLENRDKVTTNAMIHINSPRIRTPTPNSLLHNRSLSPMRPQSVRSSTPVDANVSSSAKSSPQKEDMRRSVEAYYWKEIKKLKEQENYDLYLYQLQMTPYGYAEDPTGVRRSRSLSPTAQRNSRRSLSLPREHRPMNDSKEVIENPYGRMQHHSIPEGRAVVNQPPPQSNIIYGQMQGYQFQRNAPERRTIEGTPRNNSLYKPIFKRGSLTTPVQEYQDDSQNKKVSFSGSKADVRSLNSWPTKNGFTQSPPQRRMDNNRRYTLEDDVFLPATPRAQSFDVNDVYGYTKKPPNIIYDYRPASSNPYQISKQNQEVYGGNPNLRHRQEYIQMQIHPESQVRPASVQNQEPLYGPNQYVPRRLSYDNANMARGRVQEPQYVNRPQIDPRYGFKREIIVTDEIFGQFAGYIPQNPNETKYLEERPIYASRQSVAEPLYGRSATRQVSVRDKVCDMYGQIHDRDSPSLVPTNQIRKSGIILGELQRSPGSPQVIRQSYSHLPNEHFSRNSRLTASANDMYRRYPDPRYRGDVYETRFPYQDGGSAPTRPLPPVPVEKKLLSRNNSGRPDAGAASDTSDLQNAINSSGKNKKRSFFGK